MFEFRYDADVKHDLKFIESKHHRVIQEAIVQQLSHTPLEETRNRKPVNPPIREGHWELRCGSQNRYRVFYSVLIEDELEIVQILGIGEKIGERLYIAGEEIKS